MNLFFLGDPFHKIPWSASHNLFFPGEGPSRFFFSISSGPLPRSLIVVPSPLHCPYGLPVTCQKIRTARSPGGLWCQAKHTQESGHYLRQGVGWCKFENHVH